MEVFFITNFSTNGLLMAQTSLEKIKLEVEVEEEKLWYTSNGNEKMILA